MMKRREMLNLLMVTGVSAALPLDVGKASGQLKWTTFPEPKSAFGRAPILLAGETEAILIDGGSMMSQGKAIARKIQDSGKTLTTIFVTCSDPDYYFNLKPIADAFPSAKIIAPTSIVDAIKRTVQGKIDFWGPASEGEAPKSVNEVVFPEPVNLARLVVDNHAIDVIAAAQLPNRYYVWVPGLEAVFGGVLVSSGVHVWVADTATREMRAAWIAELDHIISRNPAIVVPGHQPIGTSDGLDAVRYTRAYLLAFEEEVAQAKTSDDLITKMKARYRDALFPIQLEIGAKVAKGEMKWG